MNIPEPGPVVLDTLSALVPFARDDAGFHDPVLLARDGDAILLD
jgi:hypothetical protein